MQNSLWKYNVSKLADLLQHWILHSCPKALLCIIFKENVGKKKWNLHLLCLIGYIKQVWIGKKTIFSSFSHLGAKGNLDHYFNLQVCPSFCRYVYLSFCSVTFQLCIVMKSKLRPIYPMLDIKTGGSLMYVKVTCFNTFLIKNNV